MMKLLKLRKIQWLILLIIIIIIGLLTPLWLNNINDSKATIAYMAIKKMAISNTEVIVSTENLNSSVINKLIKNKIKFLSSEEIQKKKKVENFQYIIISKLKIENTTGTVSINEYSDYGSLGHGCTITYRKIKSSWIEEKTREEMQI